MQSQSENSFSGYRSVSPTLVTEGSAEPDDRTITKRGVFIMTKQFNYRQKRIGGIAYYKHRLIMEIALGRSLLSSEHIHHINGDILDNRTDNLQIISPKEHGRISADTSGEKNGRSKLTEAQVETIRNEKSIGERTSALAKKYKVSDSTISNIFYGRNW